MPIALTDDQLEIITRHAEPLPAADRDKYLHRVASLLHGVEIGDGAQQVAGLSESGAYPPRFAVRSLVLPTGVAGAYSHLAADVIIVELESVAGACIPFATRNEIKFFDCQFARLRNSCRPHGSSFLLRWR